MKQNLVALMLFLLGMAPLAALDPNERQEALRHLQIVRKEAGILVRLAATSAPQTVPTSDPKRVSAVLSRTADALTAAVEAQETEAFEKLYEQLDEAADAVEPAAAFFPPRSGVRSRIANVRWSVGRVAKLIGLEDEEAEKYTVGPVSPEQREVLLARVDTLLERAVGLSAKLNEADPEMMYRNLLIAQMSAFIDPAAALKVAVNARPPWWTFDAYNAVTKVTRVVALTKTETKKLTPELLETLKAVWVASEELEAAANEIERGARASGPEAQVEYLPPPSDR